MLGKRSVFLIGPMGSGKSAVGRLLARMLDAAFYDSDAEIERRTGVDISYIFEREGEAGFRQREREVIDELTQRDPVVLATGGGAVVLAENRRRLAERGCVVYLEASVEQQVRRVHYARHRPLLANVDPAVKLKQLMNERGSLYLGIADLTVPTDGRKVQSVAEDIMRGLKLTDRPQSASSR
jgi:shikimate kinase